MTSVPRESILADGEVFRLMLDRSPLPVSIQDANWQFVFANQAYCDYVGYELTELLGRDPSTFLFPSEGFAESKSHRRWAQTRALEEFSQPGVVRELIRRDGQRRRFRADMGHSQTERGEDLWCGILFDLTKLDELQADLSTFQEQADAMQIRFDSFAELSNEGMLIIDADNETVLHANGVVDEITGVIQKVDGRPFSDLLKHVDPNDLPRLRSMLSRGGTPRGVETHVALSHPASGKRSIRVRSFRSPGPESETFVLLEDVTDHIRYEQERLSIEVMRRDAVVKEIHHRVNNQLHGVLSLLERSLLSTDTKETALDAAIARINTIANLNGLLTGNSSEVPLLPLVVQIASHAEKTHGNHVAIDLVSNQHEIKGISIDNDAVAIALAINDLVVHGCNLSGENHVLVRIAAMQASIRIQIVCRRGALDQPSEQSDPYGLGLAKSLLHGTDSSIVRTESDGEVEISLTLGPTTLGRVDTSLQ